MGVLCATARQGATVGGWTGEPGPKSPTEAAAGTASAILKILQPLEFRAPLTYAGSPETAAGPPPKLGKPGSSRRVRGQPAAPVSPPVRVPGTSIHDEVRPRVGDHPGTAPSQPMANRMGRHMGDRKNGTKELRRGHSWEEGRDLRAGMTMGSAYVARTRHTLRTMGHTNRRNVESKGQRRRTVGARSQPSSDHRKDRLRGGPVSARNRHTRPPPG